MGLKAMKINYKYLTPAHHQDAQGGFRLDFEDFDGIAREQARRMTWHTEYQKSI
jgi:hypothetical protein